MHQQESASAVLTNLYAEGTSAQSVANVSVRLLIFFGGNAIVLAPLEHPASTDAKDD
jgi:succinate-acetate transporter protein